MSKEAEKMIEATTVFVGFRPGFGGRGWDVVNISTGCRDHYTGYRS